MRVDRPLVAFFASAFAIAYASAWGLAEIAERSGFESWRELNDLAEVWALAPVADRLAVPPVVVYGLSRAADFAFSIAGVVAIAASAGAPGLRELGARLVRFRVGWDGFEAVFPALADVGWETPFVVGVLVTGIAVGLALRRASAPTHA